MVDVDEKVASVGVDQIQEEVKKCGDDSSSMSSDYDVLIRKSEQFNKFNYSVSSYDDPGIIGNTL